MDFPIFHLDFMGNRLLVAIIAILHVLINHSLAVGMIPLVAYLEYVGYKKKNKNWDELARKIMFVAFIITTSLGAMTGVGIWLSASLVSPNSIGSLIRVFFGAWFVEWMVFVTEVVLILFYFLTWKKSNQDQQSKRKHIKLGFSLALFSWITMAIIVAILGFMMDPGSWNTDKSFVSGFFNPLYLPQLSFRTPVAMIMGGAVSLFLIPIFTEKKSSIRKNSINLVSIWILAWSPWAFVGSMWYYARIPDMMEANLSVAINTQEFAEWYTTLVYVIFGSILTILVIALWGMIKSESLFRPALVVPLIVSFFLLIIFERAREFIRKPYVIGNYMYSNTFRKEELPLLQRDGILKYATYVKFRTITSENKIQAGKDIFLLTCSRCHTMGGINSVVAKFENLLGKDNLDPNVMKTYIRSMHTARKFMPPFPGNEAEADALVHFIKYSQTYKSTAEGAQEAGVTISAQ